MRQDGVEDGKCGKCSSEQLYQEEGCQRAFSGRLDPGRAEGFRIRTLSGEVVEQVERSEAHELADRDDTKREEELPLNGRDLP